MSDQSASKIEIITPPNGSPHGTRIMIDGVEQIGITEAHLHIEMNKPIRFEITRLALAGVYASGTGRIDETVLCPACKKDQHGLIGISDLGSLIEKFASVEK